MDSKPQTRMVAVDDDGDPIFCRNARYMGGKQLSMAPRCVGCEHEVSDFLHGSTGMEWFVYYCDFNGGK